MSGHSPALTLRRVFGFSGFGDRRHASLFRILRRLRKGLRLAVRRWRWRWEGVAGAGAHLRSMSRDKPCRDDEVSSTGALSSEEMSFSRSMSREEPSCDDVVSSTALLSFEGMSFSRSIPGSSSLSRGTVGDTLGGCTVMVLSSMVVAWRAALFRLASRAFIRAPSSRPRSTI